MHNIRCITRAPLDALSDRSFRIRTRLEARFVLYKIFFAWICLFFNMATAGLKFADAALWIDLRHIQKRCGGDLWMKLIGVNTRRAIGSEDVSFSSRAIDWDWSIDQGRGRRIDHSPPWLVTGKQDQDRFVIFVRMTSCHCLWLTGKKVCIGDKLFR